MPVPSSRSHSRAHAPARHFRPDPPLHVIQRGNNREPIFFGDADYQCHHALVAEAAAIRL